MQIFKSLADITKEAKGAVIAIGNFDGVHRGHQALLAKAKDIAKETGKKVGVLTFEPHPRRLFQPDMPPARLAPEGLKAQRLEKENVDFLFSLEFNWDFASQSANDFVQKILINGLAAHHIIIGDNFKFGQMRKGSSETIIDAGLPVSVVTAVKDEKGETISSSRIRQYLRTGDIQTANELLGWDWEIQGVIVHGDRRGHELGYPTANILLHDTMHPAYGSYACRVQIEGEEEWLPAATNIGIRPMFELEEGQLEAHILDFPDRDIYGKTLRVKLVQRLRSEAKFNSLDELIIQMEKDCTQAKGILS